MSTQRGNNSRTRPQKYKNRTVFKNDLHDKTEQQKRLNAFHVSEVCQHCKGIIEWKIKYKKYKPLTQPKTCTRCQERNITKAYHVLCRGCALDTRVCAKCLKGAHQVEIEPPQPTPEEQLKLKVEMERLTKSFPERKRRAFLRYMEKGKTIEPLNPEIQLDDGIKINEQRQQQLERRIPRSRDELLQKIEQLKLTVDEDPDYDSNSESSFSDEDDGEVQNLN